MSGSVNEVELACSCCLELQDAELPLALLPVAYDDASWLSKRAKAADANLLALVSVGVVANEIRLAKATKAFLALHSKWEKKVADALHRAMRRMQADVKRRIVDFQSLEPSRILPNGKWWRAARQAVLGPLTQAAFEMARETLKDYNRRRLRKQDDLSWSDSGDVLIAIPPDAKAAMTDGIAETMGKDYWMAWEDTTRASVFQTITTGMDAHLNLLQIADAMDDAWAFDYKRAMLVARTECTGSLNAAHNAISHKLTEDPKSIVNGKEWLSIIDNDTRPAHRAANGQRVLKLSNGAWVVQDAEGNQIGTGDTFILGDERARYPGDPNLSAANRCHCRCTQASVFEGELGEGAAAAEESVVETPAAIGYTQPTTVPVLPLLPTEKPRASIWPESPADLEFVQDLGGSTGARLMRDTIGRRFVLKSETGGARLHEEYLAEQMYRASGVRVPDSRLYVDGENVKKLSKFIPDAKELRHVSGELRETAMSEIRKGFGADAAMANWDVAGLELDNILIDAKGVPWRIDVGGSLRWRAMGSPKGPAFNNHATELWTMRDTAKNRSAAQIFGHMTHDEVVDSAENVIRKRKKILALIDDEQLKATMTARLDGIQEFVKTSRTLKADKWKTQYRDDFTRHQMFMDEAGVFDRFPKVLKRRGKVSVVDEDGILFDHLRGSGSAVSKLAEYVKANGGDYEAIHYYMSGQAGSSWSPASCAFKYNLLNSREMDWSKYYFRMGNPQEYLAAEWKTFVAHYASEDIVRESFTMQHVYYTNFCKRVKFPNNNVKKGVVVVGRSVSGDLVPQAVNEAAVLIHGPAESTSIHSATSFGSRPTLIVQEVPHHRVFAHYYHERTPGANDSLLFSETENEVVCMLEGLDSYNMGQSSAGRVIKLPKRAKKTL